MKKTALITGLILMTCICFGQPNKKVRQSTLEYYPGYETLYEFYINEHYKYNPQLRLRLDTNSPIIISQRCDSMGDGIAMYKEQRVQGKKQFISDLLEVFKEYEKECKEKGERVMYNANPDRNSRLPDEHGHTYSTLVYYPPDWQYKWVQETPTFEGFMEYLKKQ